MGVDKLSEQGALMIKQIRKGLKDSPVCKSVIR